MIGLAVIAVVASQNMIALLAVGHCSVWWPASPKSEPRQSASPSAAFGERSAFKVTYGRRFSSAPPLDAEAMRAATVTGRWIDDRRDHADRARAGVITS